MRLPNARPAACSAPEAHPMENFAPPFSHVVIIVAARCLPGSWRAGVGRTRPRLCAWLPETARYGWHILNGFFPSVYRAGRSDYPVCRVKIGSPYRERVCGKAPPGRGKFVSGKSMSVVSRYRRRCRLAITQRIHPLLTAVTRTTWRPVGFLREREAL